MGNHCSFTLWYLNRMKLQLFVACLAFSSLAFGQFIPQQMGYNPDENGDDLIGVNDLQVLLALYGQPFDNGDSVVVTSMTFPEDYGDVFGGNNYEEPWIFVSEETDILYLHQTEDQQVGLWLPQGSGFKVLQLFFSSEVYNWGVRIFLDNTINSDMYSAHGGVINVQPHNPFYYTLIRGQNGKWYQHGEHP